ANCGCARRFTVLADAVEDGPAVMELGNCIALMYTLSADGHDFGAAAGVAWAFLAEKNAQAGRLGRLHRSCDFLLMGRTEPLPLAMAVAVKAAMEPAAAA
ncbi:unnamed protein product, partial [Phaeothamnion confervicola]